MTLRDIAKEAGVSVGTASKAFSGATDIGAQTAERVFAAARALGCYEKYSRSRYPRRVVTLILPESKSAYYAALAEQAERQLCEKNFLVLRAEDGFSSDKRKELISYYAFYAKVDGILLLETAKTSLPAGLETPLVYISNDIPGKAPKKAEAVFLNFEGAVQAAVDALVERGHRHIAFLGERLTSAKQQIVAEAVARDPSLKLTSVVGKGRFEEAGISGVCQLAELGYLDTFSDRVTALFCAYDDVALGAMQECQRRGLSIPQDISVVGMDDIPLGRYLTPALSSVTSQPQTLCRAACDLLIKKVDCRYYRSPHPITVDAIFVDRETIRSAKTQ